MSELSASLAKGDFDAFRAAVQQTVEFAFQRRISSQEAVAELAEQVCDTVASSFARQDFFASKRYSAYKQQMVEEIWVEFEARLKTREAKPKLKAEIKAILSAEEKNMLSEGAGGIQILRLLAYRLRQKGYSFNEIGARLKVTPERAQKLYYSADARVKLLRLELKRYEP